jgi:hypothetical protein
LGETIPAVVKSNRTAPPPKASDVKQRELELRIRFLLHLLPEQKIARSSITCVRQDMQIRARQPIRLAGSPIGGVRHVCAFFANDDEEYRVLLPFIQEGLSCGDKAIHVINPGQRQEHLQRLAANGIDTAAHQTSGQLQVHANTEVYLQDGRFDQDRMLATFEEIAMAGRTTEGHPLSRIVCRMDWAANDRSQIGEVIEFESRVNDVWSRYDDVVICTYHLSQFSGDAVIDIMRTHPLVMIGAHLQQNPFFTPTDEFLREYRGRRTNPKSYL